VITVDQWLVDVGGTYVLSGADSEDFNGDTEDLEYFWTGLSENAVVDWEDRCQDVPEETCDENLDDVCREPQKTDCTVNADCEVGLCKIGKMVCAEKQTTFCNSNDDCEEGDCRTNSGNESPDCSEGPCEIGGGQEDVIASFQATAPGPYFVRLLVTGKQANQIALQLLDTYPSMYLLGSLYQFGGTEGGLVGFSADADTFAPGALRGVAQPETGNLLLAVPSLGSVREFSGVTNEIVGTFGETNNASEPIALAYSADNALLYVANADGVVQIYDGVQGLAGGDFGDVTAGVEEVLSILFAPNGNLLVVDGRPGQAIREYDAATGVFLGAYGQTGAAVTQATDAIFFGDNQRLLISDAAGDVISCNKNGRACVAWGSAGASLAANGPTSIAANPSGDVNPSAQVLIADRVNAYVLGCDDTGNGCAPFGDTVGLDSEYYDVFFAPSEIPSTTTTTTTLPPTVSSTSSTSTITLPRTTTTLDGMSSTTSTTVVSAPTTTLPQ
jgi:hypothetical protein